MTPILILLVACLLVVPSAESACIQVNAYVVKITSFSGDLQVGDYLEVDTSADPTCDPSSNTCFGEPLSVCYEMKRDDDTCGGSDNGTVKLPGDNLSGKYRVDALPQSGGQGACIKLCTCQ